MIKTNKNIILASVSPRRQQFLKELKIPFSIQLKEVEEIYPNDLVAEEIPEFLAQLKAAAFTDLKADDLLITSDTIVWHNNTALGKPKDKADATAMLQVLSGDTHTVITSVCIKTADTTEVFSSATEVTFTNLNRETIEFYIDKYKPFDKAGAYGIQEWIGQIGISKITGCYNTVVGFPTQLFYTKLLSYV
jgi:septum formation protein